MTLVHKTLVLAICVTVHCGFCQGKNPYAECRFLRNLGFAVALQFHEKLVGVVELPIDAGETYVCHLIDPGERPHDDFANFGRGDFEIRITAVNMRFNVGYDFVDLLFGDWSLPAGAGETLANLFGVEPFEGLVPLFDTNDVSHGSFGGREPLVARLTDTPTPHGETLFGGSRVLNAVVVFSAIRTLHISIIQLRRWPAIGNVENLSNSRRSLRGRCELRHR